jgi:starch synthase
MKILQVSAEIFPLLKTGGLADIAGALPAALTDVGCDVRLLLPGFDPILQNLQNVKLLGTRITPWGESVSLIQGYLVALGMQAYVIDAPTLYARAGNPYEDQNRQPYADNYRRFALLGWMAAQMAMGMDLQWQPQVVHSHDWHSGLAGAYLAFTREQQPIWVGSVYTVHNLAYQGLFDAKHFAELGLPDSAFSVDGLEFYGQISFMKAGLFYADQITTVSPTYAKEIQTPEQGCGLEGLLFARRNVLSGILNAVDETVWNPATDAQITATYSATNRAGKTKCKLALQQKMGLTIDNQIPLFGVVSRLTEQKGLHLVVAAINELIASGGQLVVLGSGEAALENALRDLAARHPHAVAVRLGYDEAFAHQIFSATDVTLVPSRFEPCGLTQMYGLKYGSLPLVRRVGGLADTVIDCTPEHLLDQTANGFVFEEFSDQGFTDALKRAFVLYSRPSDWHEVVARSLQQAFSWQASAQKYLALYRKAVGSSGVN